MHISAIIDRILRKAVEEDASDIYIQPDCPVFFRIKSEMIPWEEVNPRIPDVNEMVDSIYGGTNIATKLYEPQELDTSFEIKDREGYQVTRVYRFRVNIALTEGVPAIVFRRLKIVTTDPSELGIPEQVVDDIKSTPYGLFLITGPTGSGKSTTLACILSHMTSISSIACVTIEDPIEYKILPGMSCVMQREVGKDTPSFAKGLRAAMREKPDIILVGEIRDPETAIAAIQAAKSGHRVLSTMHTSEATSTLSRIVGMFDSDRQPWITSELRDILTGVTVQRLVPKVNGEHTLCTEYLKLIDGKYRDMLCDGHTKELRETMKSGKVGWLLNQSMLSQADETKGISREMLYSYTNNLEELSALLEEEEKSVAASV
jgi:twitching motility protein PilT